MNTLDTREGDDMQSEMEKKGMLFRAESAIESTNSDQALHERIARRAYELYQKRGQPSGHDLEDWLEAEALIKAELRSQGETPRGRAPWPETERQRTNKR